MHKLRRRLARMVLPPGARISRRRLREKRPTKDCAANHPFAFCLLTFAFCLGVVFWVGLAFCLTRPTPPKLLQNSQKSILPITREPPSSKTPPLAAALPNDAPPPLPRLHRSRRP